jgi:TatD DNase family protein
VTKPNAKKVVRALKRVSKERFVLETDTPDIYPYLPEHILGKKASRLNEPKNLPAIAQIASARVDMEFDKFSNQAYDNSMKLFHPILG